jgi:hypothetical protein
MVIQLFIRKTNLLQRKVCILKNIFYPDIRRRLRSNLQDQSKLTVMFENTVQVNCFNRY